jgi:CheY-like chemotaxis protein
MSRRQPGTFLLHEDFRPSQPLHAMSDSLEFLVVEDDPVMQHLTCGMLDRLGYGSQVVSDGVQAIEACVSRAPTAVLMDLQMPRLDGLAATRELRRLQRQGGLRRFPIIVVSAFYSPEERAACFEAGVDGFVTKPLMLAKLGAEIVRVLGRRDEEAGLVAAEPPPRAWGSLPDEKR